MLGPAVPQIHDYNPGITASGLFWTIRVPDRAVRIDRRTGFASYAQANVGLDDYANLATALAGGPSTPAIASFVITWRPTGRMQTARDEANKFVTRYRLAESRLGWSAHGGAFSFKSDPAKTSGETFAMIGTERNGVFFR